MSRSTHRKAPKGTASKGCRVAAIRHREDRKALRYGIEAAR